MSKQNGQSQNNAKQFQASIYKAEKIASEWKDFPNKVIEYYRHGNEVESDVDDDVKVKSKEDEGKASNDPNRKLDFHEVHVTKKELREHMRIFMAVTKQKPPIIAALESYVENMQEHTSADYHTLIFLKIHDDNKSNRTEAVFMLTTGQAWRAAAPFADPKFPRNIAKRLLDENIDSKQDKHVFGSISRTNEEYALPPILLQSDLAISQILDGHLRKKCSLTEDTLFQTKGGEPRQTSLQISLRNIRFGRNFSLDDYITIAKMLLRVDACLTKDKEEDFFKSLDNIHLHSHEDAKKLNEKLTEGLKQSLENSVESKEINISHREFGNFRRADYFYINEIKFWRDPSISITTQFINQLRVMWKEIKNRDFLKWINNVKIRYQRLRAAEPFIRFLHGEVEMFGRKCVKCDGQWYSFNSDYSKAIEKDFQQLLKSCLVYENNHEGARLLHNSWNDKSLQESNGNGGETPSSGASSPISSKSFTAQQLFTAGRLKERNKLQNKLISSLLKTKIIREDNGDNVNSKYKYYFVNPDGPFTSTSEHPFEDNNERKFRDCLGKKNPDETFFDNTMITTLLKRLNIDSVIEELTSDEKKKLLGALIKNSPSTSKPKRNYRENTFNCQFGGKDGYLVGDRVCVEGIELFDVLKYDKDNNVIYLYHNKIGFGQTVRDVCSQIRNAADFLLKKDIKVIFELTGMKEQLRCWSKFKNNNYTDEAICEDVVKQFTEAHIHFVFGFMEDAKIERQLEQELNRDLETDKTQFASTIARCELLLTQKHLRKLTSPCKTVELRILQIPRSTTSCATPDSAVDRHIQEIPTPSETVTVGEDDTQRCESDTSNMLQSNKLNTEFDKVADD